MPAGELVRLEVATTEPHPSVSFATADAGDDTVCRVGFWWPCVRVGSGEQHVTVLTSADDPGVGTLIVTPLRRLSAFPALRPAGDVVIGLDGVT
ncbi:MAG: hypothetical protein GWN07_17030, partial [Actinobacteria bacterium]|nr:hypothetical protein [Actinomycetota bacterium]NIU67178.1 hypothetical protein [Actinomycetota bacterium]NIW28957.1 hypothetical protein [Actinomycetota bacterium]NIX21440.1 hypothetical protein [Actinomycetota bacterium]